MSIFKHVIEHNQVMEIPMRQHGFLFLFWLLVVGPLAAQFYETTRYADHNGLPSRIVRDVDQDPNGYLWVAGNNGLYKFDGQQFHAYYSVLNDTTGLRDNKINTLLAASDGRVWIATPKGLHVTEGEDIRYVELTPNATDVQNHVIEIFEDSQQQIWVGTYAGLFLIENGSDTVRSISEKNKSILIDYAIWGINEDSQGRIWVSRSKQPPLLAEKGSHVFREIPFEISRGLIEKDIRPFNYIDYDGSLFVVSSGSGVLQGRLTERGTFAIAPFLDSEGSIAGDHFVYNTILDADRNIWIATWRNYFKKYRIEDGTLIEQEVICTNGLEDMSIFARSIFADSQGNIWVPNSNGLYKLSETEHRITVFPPGHVEACSEDTYSIYGIVEDRSGHIWLSTPFDLYRFDKQDILNNQCPSRYLHLTDSKFELARDLYIDSADRLWVSGEGGLSIAQLDANGDPGPFAHFNEDNGLPHRWSTGILEEDPNTFWVGNYHLLLKIELPDGDFRYP
ncbi:MAG: two-component regulator propeller domain-containing protein, partial [Bacteroidota bacterium]